MAVHGEPVSNISGGEKLEGYLKTLAANVTKPATLEVGFFEDATYPDGTSVAMVAAIQNFGAPSKNIPPRPFFSNMVKDKADGWGPKVGALLNANNGDATVALGQMGLEIKADLQDSIVATNSPPLSPRTIAARLRRGKKGKGFNSTTAAKPLVDTGQMLNSVASRVV